MDFPAESLVRNSYSETLDNTPHEASYRWLSEPHWYLWEGGFLLIGRANGEVPFHAHHAIQIVLALDGEVAIRGASDASVGAWGEGRGIIVQSDVTHAFNCQGAFGAMIFVDPESSEGSWLRAAVPAGITMVPEARLAAPVEALRTFIERPLEGLEPGELIRTCVHALSPGAPPSRSLDPRVASVLNAIRSRVDLRFSLDAGAEMAFLSPSRFAHLFKEEVGLPFSRYMLWRKLTRAMVAIGSERTIAAAAHAADFADAAHLTRTFYQMVGMAPSALMRGRFSEIASPFNTYREA